MTGAFADEPGRFELLQAFYRGFKFSAKKK